MKSDPYHPFQLEIIRSEKRTKTIQAGFRGEYTIVVRVPYGLSPEIEEKEISEVVEKLLRKRTSAQFSEDTDLMARAKMLNERYLENQARPSSIRWVSNQKRQWGSCKIVTGEIRISDRLKLVPEYVLDSVLIHELTHTFVHSGHSTFFWEWAQRAPQFERAQGFLEAYDRFGASRT